MPKAKKKYKSYYKPKKPKIEIDASLVDQIRKQILDEIKADSARNEALAEKARNDADAIREKFVAEMKASPEPWVDVIFWVETPTGVKYQLDWNDAFIKHLRNNGIEGIDDDTIVQRWTALLLRTTVDEMENKLDPDVESKFN